MSMTRRGRKLALTAHVTFSVGWLGAVVAYLVVAIAGFTTPDSDMARSAYLAMWLVAKFVILPFSFGALLTGLAQSLGTEWGLFRHYWILVKFVATIGATLVLLVHLPTVNRMSEIAAATVMAAGDFGMMRTQLVVHAAGGLAVLLAITAISIFKPWGRTPWAT